MTPRPLIGWAVLAALATAGPSAAAPAPRSASAHSALPTLATLRFPGTLRFVAVAKDVVALRFAIDPSIAAGAGLMDDACRGPSFDPDTVRARLARLDRDLAALRAMPWRTWSVDRQIDWRWVVANAEDARLQLADERLFVHRPAAWLEPLANTFIALVTYAPERADLRLALARGIPRMVDEMRRVAVSPTARDVATAKGVSDGIMASLRRDAASAEREAAITALSGYINGLQQLQGLAEFRTIGRERYETRLRRALLLPWDGDQLLARANAELAATDSAMAALKARISRTPTSRARRRRRPSSARSPRRCTRRSCSCSTTRSRTPSARSSTPPTW